QGNTERERIDVVAERKVIAARVERKRHHEGNQRKQRHSLLGANGASEHMLNDAHLDAQPKSPHERTENSKIHPHLPEEARRNILVVRVAERLRAESHHAGWQLAQPAVTRWNRTQY